MDEYTHSKSFGRIDSTHVNCGQNLCEKVFRYVPNAPFPWTWHGAAPHIELRVTTCGKFIFIRRAPVFFRASWDVFCHTN